MEDWAEIRRLHRAEGLPIKAIARVLASIPGAVIVLRFLRLVGGHRGGKVNCRVRLSHQGIGVLVSA